MVTRKETAFGDVFVLSEEEAQGIKRFGSIIGYARRKAAGQRILPRAKGNPSELKAHLPYIFLWDIFFDDTGSVSDAHVRLSGTQVDRFYGNMTDTLWSDYPDPIVKARAMSACRRLVEERVIFAYGVNGITVEQHSIHLHVLYIPLSSDGSMVDKVLGCLDVYRTLPEAGDEGRSLDGECLTTPRDPY